MQHLEVIMSCSIWYWQCNFTWHKTVGWSCSQKSSGTRWAEFWINRQNEFRCWNTLCSLVNMYWVVTTLIDSREELGCKYGSMTELALLGPNYLSLVMLRSEWWELQILLVVIFLSEYLAVAVWPNRVRELGALVGLSHQWLNKTTFPIPWQLIGSLIDWLLKSWLKYAFDEKTVNSRHLELSFQQFH